MDIIVTTPKSKMKEAVQEAADCIAAGGGEYFRRFPINCYPISLRSRDRVYYVEDGYVRGFALVSNIARRIEGFPCRATGTLWPPGVFVFMAADSWKWIKPIPMKGFRGFRYADQYFTQIDVDQVGGWLDPKPEVPHGQPV